MARDKPRDLIHEDEVPVAGLDCIEVRLMSGGPGDPGEPPTPAINGDDDAGDDIVESEPADPDPFYVGTIGRDRVRAVLAFGLLGLLAMTVVLIIAGRMTHQFTPDDAEWIATALVGPEVALLGAATGWFFGKS